MKKQGQGEEKDIRNGVRMKMKRKKENRQSFIFIYVTFIYLGKVPTREGAGRQLSGYELGLYMPNRAFYKAGLNRSAHERNNFINVE